VLARIAGFGRTVVYGRTVGAGCVGDVYTTANIVPNIIFDVVAGGTLSALVVPILAPALAVEGRQAASRILSGLLTWIVLVMAVVAAAIATLAGPLTHLLLGHGQCPGAGGLGTRMLVAFAPQVVFYGLGIVLGGALQAAERFTWPALAPLLSSLVVISAYAVYATLSSPGRDAAHLSRTAELVLSVGTTLGVVALAACQLPPVLRLGLRLRPTLRFPVGLTPTIRQAALAGGATLGAQQIATAVMIRLANSETEKGTAVVVTFAQTVYLLPWAVLAVPVATSVYPRLAAASGSDPDAGPRVAALTARALKIVAALAGVGTAALIASSSEIARVMLDPRGSPAQHAFAPAIIGFAVGLLGWSLVALLARVLYAAGEVPRAAAGQVLGWGVAIVADLVLAATLPASSRAVVLAVGNAIGVTVAAGLLLGAARRAGALASVGPALRDSARAAGAAALGAAAGWSLSWAADPTGILASLAIGAVAGVLGAGVAVVALAMADPALVETARGFRRTPPRPHDPAPAP
jgi:putative peptidoglycan lipid II flippase